jgi:hemolysin activation/secretion protein
VIGNGDIVTFQANYALPGTEQLTQSLFGSFSYKHFLEGTPLIAGIPVTTGSGGGLFPITYFPFALGYGASIQEEDARTDLDVSLNFALRGIGTDWQNFDNARFNARSSFFYVKADASRTQDLPLGLSGYVRLGVQFADQPLNSHEQYSLGGINSVRGYLESEELADSALAGSVELRSPSFADIVDAGIDEWRVFGFYDGVAGWLRSPVAPERQAYGLEGAGIGTSLTMLGHLHGVVDLAWPLVTGTVTRAGAMRTQFRVWTDF